MMKSKDSSQKIYTLVHQYQDILCRISTPSLYTYPFHHFRRLVYSKDYLNTISSYFRLIRTLLSCIPKSEIEQIILSTFPNERNLLSNISSNPMFNYITFIRGLSFNKLLLPNSAKLFISNDTITSDQLSKISDKIINYFIKFVINPF